MILSCPDCRTRFAIDAAHLAPDGRRVKCGKCAHVWYESMPELEDDPPIPIEVTPYDPKEDGANTRRNLPALRQLRSGRGARTAWMVSAALLVAILAVLWFGRGPIALAVPQAETLYASIGIDAFPPPGEGLEVEFSVSAAGGKLALKGEVINVSNGARDIPELYVLISDGDKNILKSWSFMIGTARLGPGERASFTSQTEEVPAGAANVSVLFTNPDETP
ncbi:MAG: zinc-ribbon domain-containing protein [Proteobacteria bacterium]|nr:zinc-ribbon domain-containing protein [Pseudomonadota bacterium]